MNHLNRRRACVGFLALASLHILCSLSGCASSTAGRSGGPPQRIYMGWVRFSGEFVLYSDAQSFASSATTHCVSGALPPGKQQEAAAQLNGKRVWVVGKLVPWQLSGPDVLTMNNQGSVITNWCGNENVLFASKMLPDEGKGRSGDH